MRVFLSGDRWYVDLTNTRSAAPRVPWGTGRVADAARKARSRSREWSTAAYSERSAIIGSTPAARRAGKMQASPATDSSITMTNPIVVGWVGVRPNRKLSTRRENERERHTEHEPQTREEERVTRHDPQYFRARAAERDAQANLLRALEHMVGHHAIEADARQQQRDAAEEPGQVREQPLAPQRAIHLVDQRLPIGNDDVGVRLYDLPDRGGQQLRRTRALDLNRAWR